jgi:hypothetical protein
MPEPDIDLNSEALAKAIRFVGRKSLLLGGIVLLITVAIGVLGGTTTASENSTPGWGSVFFMYGGAQSLAVVIPIALCLYLGITLVSGAIAFFYFRFPKK